MTDPLGDTLLLAARPEPLALPRDKTAVIVVDMQNAYASPGGYLDLAGFDIAGAKAVIGKIAEVLDVARGGWDYALVDDLQPKPGDIVLPKTRYSGFFNSQLDSVLRARSIRHIVLVGIATNVCVESTLRDGFFLEYFGTVLADATHQAGPEFLQEASLYNIEKFFGWVSTTDDFRATFGQLEPS